MRSRICTLAFALVASFAAPAAADVADDLKEGDRYYEESEWKKAANAYDSAIKSAPRDVSPEAYGKRASIFIIQKDYKNGLEFVRKVAKAAHPDAGEILEARHDPRLRHLQAAALNRLPEELAVHPVQAQVGRARRVGDGCLRWLDHMEQDQLAALFLREEGGQSQGVLRAGRKISRVQGRPNLQHVMLLRAGTRPLGRVAESITTRRATRGSRSGSTPATPS